MEGVCHSLIHGIRRHGMEHPHQWALLSHSLTMNSKTFIEHLLYVRRWGHGDSSLAAEVSGGKVVVSASRALCRRDSACIVWSQGGEGKETNSFIPCSEQSGQLTISNVQHSFVHSFIQQTLRYCWGENSEQEGCDGDRVGWGQPSCSLWRSRD